ncbi:MAG: hypothetical protein D6739_09460 [Nitrospirae bacterium]|nr:MAG: hypothetical protein D6739_09460 [Nitrospirota bacterium]
MDTLRHRTLPLLAAAALAVAASTPAAAATVGQATRLAVYKQRVRLTAPVHCSRYERTVLTCSAPVAGPVEEALEPELLLRFTRLWIRGKAIPVHESPASGELRFPAGGVDYSGTQEMEVEVIYVK